MRRFAGTTLVVLALALTFAASPAQAQAIGSTDIDINIPDIVILHYYSSVDVTISSSALGTFLTGTGTDIIDEGTAIPVAGGFDQDLNILPTPLVGDAGSAVLVLRNAWAVRSVAISSGVDTAVTIANTDNTLDHTTTSASIAITGVAVDDGSSSGTTISFTAPGLSTPHTGDVELTLDLSNATNAGAYEDGVYTLTASNI